MLSQSAVASPQVVVIRERAVKRNTTLVLGVLALLMGIVGAITMNIGFNFNCHYNYNSQGINEYYYECNNKSRAYKISGCYLLSASGCCLVAAIVWHYRMRKSARLNQFNPHQQPVIVSPGYSGQSIIGLNSMSTQYHPSSALSTGPPLYPHSPAANQDPPNVGFTASS